MSDAHHDALQKGAPVNEYEVVRVLGRGGFGITYLAFDLNLNGPVALKEYFPVGYAKRLGDGSVGPASPDNRAVFDWGLKRFLAEAQAIHRFRHPNVVRAHRYFEARGGAFIVMEYLEGDSLAKILKDRAGLTFAEWRPLFEKLLDGLEHVHDHDYLHRDLKPGNIVVREADGAPVLIDFGSARVATGERTNTPMVTDGYAPIEQHGEGKQGPPADLYALAAVSYRALLGKRPPTAPDRATNDTIARLEGYATGAERSWLAALDRCLALHPKDRPRSVAALRKEFRKRSLASNSPAVQEYRLRFQLPKSGRGMAFVRNVAAPFDDWAARRWVGRRSSGAINATVFAPFHRTLGTDAGKVPLFEKRLGSEAEGFAWLLELEESGAIEKAARERIERATGKRKRNEPPPSGATTGEGTAAPPAGNDLPRPDDIEDLLAEDEPVPDSPWDPTPEPTSHGEARNPGAAVLWLWYGTPMAAAMCDSSRSESLWLIGIAWALSALIASLAAFKVGKWNGAVMLGLYAAIVAVTIVGIQQEWVWAVLGLYLCGGAGIWWAGARFCWKRLSGESGSKT